MAKLLVSRKGYNRKSYTRKGGVRVKASSVKPAKFKIPDRGQRGRTPMGERWFEPKVHSGWDKDMAMGTRRSKALRAHKGDKLATARSLQALANVTTDKKTKILAKTDASYFFREHRQK